MKTENALIFRKGIENESEGITYFLMSCEFRKNENNLMIFMSFGKKKILLLSIYFLFNYNYSSRIEQNHESLYTSSSFSFFFNCFFTNLSFFFVCGNIEKTGLYCQMNGYFAAVDELMNRCWLFSCRDVILIVLIWNGRSKIVDTWLHEKFW